MNDIVAEISGRRALRAIDERPIAEELLRRILEAATLAPSCSNNQPWRYLVMQSPEALAKGREALTKGNYWAKKAPVLICIFTRKEDDCVSSEGRDYALFDCGLAAANLMIQATAEGLIAHPMAGFDAAAMKKGFDLADDAIPILFIALGYPGDESGLSEKHKASEHAPRTRKPLEETVIFA
jgi:nitroreductase